tara:strand:- start:129 stop:395 length:267 start_codon:yes stop_codon:yes gene_type:complete
MKLSHEQSNLITTALQNMRADKYLNNNLSEAKEIENLILLIEEETEPKDLSQKKIMISDERMEIGSETGIEEEYQLQIPPKKCEVCDD